MGPTKVGCAVLPDDGRIFAVCNVEHRFPSHDVHAEVNAITTMVAGGAGRDHQRQRGRILAVVVVAERDQFTPCGACMDWILQFCDACVVAFPALGSKHT
jgi:cytidine deaminase